ncbi:MAG TPA: hypothetical protein VN673_12290 [Clostridia bacterium]|nr:hypothetical protein [Clostridia bacterium]
MGASAHYDHAIAIWDSVVNSGHIEFGSSANKAFMLRVLNNDRGAVECYDKEIEVWVRVVSDEILGERAFDLAKAYLNKAVLVGPPWGQLERSDVL